MIMSALPKWFLSNFVAKGSTGQYVFAAKGSTATSGQYEYFS